MLEYAIVVTGEDDPSVEIKRGDVRLQYIPSRLTPTQLDDFWIRREALFSTTEDEFARAAAEFGEHLFCALANDVSRNDILTQISNGEQLRISLEFIHTDPRWQALPWECMQIKYVGVDTRLATNPRLSFVRLWGHSLRDSVPHPAEGEPLRLLLLYAGHEDESRKLKKPMLGPLEASLKELEGRGLIALTYDDSVTEKSLRAHFNEQWHIVHFVGHGTKDADGNGQPGLLLKTSSGGAAWVPKSKIIDAILQNPPHFVFLQACESAAGAGDEIASSLAEELMGKDVSGVLAMQFRISNIGALEFARNFYSAFAEGAPVDVATQHARSSLGDARAIIPVLHLRIGAFDLLRPVETLRSGVIEIMNDLESRSRKIKLLKKNHLEVQHIQNSVAENFRPDEVGGEPVSRVKLSNLEWSVSNISKQVSKVMGDLQHVETLTTELEDLGDAFEPLQALLSQKLHDHVNKNTIVSIVVTDSPLPRLEHKLMRLSSVLNDGLKAAVVELDAQKKVEKMMALLGDQAHLITFHAQQLVASHAKFTSYMEVHRRLQTVEESSREFIEKKSEMLAAYHAAMPTADMADGARTVLKMLIAMYAPKLREAVTELLSAIAECEECGIESSGLSSTLEALNREVEGGDPNTVLELVDRLLGTVMTVFMALDSRMISSSTEVMTWISALGGSLRAMR